MARTKQTARKTVCSFGSKHIPIKKKKAVRGKSGVKAEEDSDVQQVVNTQQFSVKFDDQDKCEKEHVEMQIYRCQECQAILTKQGYIYSKEKYSQLKSQSSIPDEKKHKYLTKHNQVWICEFCRSHNDIPKQFKIPKIQNPCYLIEKNKNQKSKIKSIIEGKVLIFCIDISGSMDLKLGNKTRLQSVKQAIVDQINRMKFQKQKIKVGLITFGSYVNLIGDGDTFKQQQLETSFYHSFENIVKHCKKINNFCSIIQKSYKSLKQNVQGLSVHGSTALGPGLLSAVELASKGGVGSKVILCTDGEANVGLGGNFSSDRFTFYSQLSEYTKNKRVMVNILSLKGDKCNLKQLGKLSLATGGSLLKINPDALGTQFSKIIQEEILGSQSRLVIQVVKIFRICHNNQKQLSKDKTILSQDFGNFSSETELTFQFEVINDEDQAKKAGIDLDLYKQKNAPMQIQLSYLGRDGNRYLQVITDWRQLTADHNSIYDSANFGLFAASVLQRVSLKIKNAQFTTAESILKGYWSVVDEKFSKSETKADLNKFNERIRKIERILQSKMNKAGIVSKKKKVPSSSTRQKQSRSRQRSSRKSKKQHSTAKLKIIQSNESEEEAMSSDSQQRILYKEMRARSRSRD